jgi:hypothetical protein
MIRTSVDKSVEKFELSVIIVKASNGAATLENSLAVVQKSKKSHYMSLHFHFWVYNEKTEYRCSNINLCTYVQRSIVNIQKVENTQMLLN